MYYIKTAEGWKPWIASHKVCDNHNKLEGVFKVSYREQVIADMRARQDRFLKALDTDQFGSSFRGAHFVEPLFGAFGEKL